MYHCQLCEAAFDRPGTRRWREPMPEGFYEPCCQLVCPRCGAGEQYFDDVHGERDGEPWESPLRARPASCRP